MNDLATMEKLTAKDFTSDQEVRWCPGCGDYAILKALQRTLPELGVSRENTVFVSGIGCSSRFPFYMSTYGFHTIHGRAPAIAAGIKLANPDLDIWLVTGDGDGLSIGGNHMLHVLRRNMNMQILLFNNEIYGLTKGQYSPTSRIGTRSPSTPLGSVESPILPCTFALGSGARFIARAIDSDLKSLPYIFKRAYEHQGASFVEIYQNCLVYNDKVFENFTARDVASERQLIAEHGKPLIFGNERNKGLRFNADALELEVVVIGENGVSASDIVVHDETNRTLASMLVRLDPDEFPVVIGVIYCDPAPVYEENVMRQMDDVTSKKGVGDLSALMRSGRIWEVE